jgi:hypothetical protein
MPHHGFFSSSVVSVNTETEPKELILISFGTEDFQELIGTYFVRNRICASTEEPNAQADSPVVSRLYESSAFFSGGKSTSNALAIPF